MLACDLCVLELFAMYATDGQTDKSNAYYIAPFPTVGGRPTDR